MIDESSGTTIRRHELHFQFDAERYREWAAQVAVWLEDEDGGERLLVLILWQECNYSCKQGCKGGGCGDGHAFFDLSYIRCPKCDRYGR